MKAKRIDFKGLKMQFFIYFALFSIIIIAMLWIFQIVFYANSYEKMKQQEVEKTGDRLVSALAYNGYKDIYDREAFNNQFVILVFRRWGDVLIVEYNSDEQLKDFQNPVNVEYFSKLIAQLDVRDYDSPLTYIDQIDIGSSSSEFQNLIFGEKVLVGGQTKYFYLSSPISPNNITLAVLKSQFLVISIILLVVGIGSAFILSRTISKPIVAISEKALKLSKRDFSVRFSENGYTEIETLSNALNLATDELSKTESLRRDLLANVSHDLKTPLTMVKGYAEMIKDISLTDEKKRAEHAEIIIKEADRLTVLINDILNMSKIESGIEKLQSAEVLCDELFETVNISFSSYCDKENITIKTDFEKNLVIYGDKQKLEQVLYNLVSNAVNYTEACGTISLSVMRKGDNVRFEVADTGRGIAENELALIWDKYYKSSRGDKVKDSTGLGLYISKCILVLHGALYGANSSVGDGSTFWFEIPVKKC